jgi:uncharacterized membrane protein YagU involved in acid resistance
MVKEFNTLRQITYIVFAIVLAIVAFIFHFMTLWQYVLLMALAQIIVKLANIEDELTGNDPFENARKRMMKKKHHSK